MGRSDICGVEARASRLSTCFVNAAGSAGYQDPAQWAGRTFAPSSAATTTTTWPGEASQTALATIIDRIDHRMFMLGNSTLPGGNIITQDRLRSQTPVSRLEPAQGAMANTGCHGQAQRGHASRTRAAGFSLRDRFAWAWHSTWHPIGSSSYPSIRERRSTRTVFRKFCDYDYKPSPQALACAISRMGNRL